MPHRYNVMAFFFLTHIWVEKMGDYTACMMRLQKVDLTTKSWWAAKDSPLPPFIRDFDTRPEKSPCTACSTTSIRIFRNGWMCLQNKCPLFWKMNGESPPPNMEYDPVFLSHRTRWTPTEFSTNSYNLLPLLPIITDDNRDDYRQGNLSRQGIVCPECQKCVPRTFWKGWKCTVKHAVGPQPQSNEVDCPFSLMIEGGIVSIKDVLVPPGTVPNPIRRLGKAAKMPRGDLESFYDLPRFDPQCMRPEVDKVSVIPYLNLSYEIGGLGTITQFVSNGAINANTHGPDYLFQRFQEVDLGLQRERLSTAIGMCRSFWNTTIANIIDSPRDDDRPFSQEYCEHIQRRHHSRSLIPF